jgi:hypothetical protein
MAPREDDAMQSSLPGLWKYPTYRKEQVKYAQLWMEGKKIDDNTCGLWRIHDGLYDFTEWIYKHPGGSDWLQITKVHPIKFCFDLIWMERKLFLSAPGSQYSVFFKHKNFIHKT